MMNLLDNLLDTVVGKENQAPEVLSSAEAFAAIILLATASNGYLSEKQANSISSVLCVSKLFRTYTNDAIDKLCDRILAILRQDGFNTLFNAAKESLSPDLRESAFALATDLVLAEGSITEEEKNFLHDLHQALGISRDTAIQIMQVMLLKNQG